PGTSRITAGYLTASVIPTARPATAARRRVARRASGTIAQSETSAPSAKSTSGLAAWLSRAGRKLDAGSVPAVDAAARPTPAPAGAVGQAPPAGAPAAPRPPAPAAARGAAHGRRRGLVRRELPELGPAAGLGSTPPRRRGDPPRPRPARRARAARHLLRAGERGTERAWPGRGDRRRRPRGRLPRARAHAPL